MEKPEILRTKKGKKKKKKRHGNEKKKREKLETNETEKKSGEVETLMAQEGTRGWRLEVRCVRITLVQ